MADSLTTSALVDRLTGLGEDKWAVHFEARRRIANGDDVIELTIGEPDIPVSSALIDVAEQAMRAGRTRYSAGRGEARLIEVIAEKYAARTGRNITPGNVLCLPGTQAALSIAMFSLVETGDDVLGGASGAGDDEASRPCRGRGAVLHLFDARGEWAGSSQDRG